MLLGLAHRDCASRGCVGIEKEDERINIESKEQLWIIAIFGVSRVVVQKAENVEWIVVMFGILCAVVERGRQHETSIFWKDTTYLDGLDDNIGYPSGGLLKSTTLS